MKMLNGVKSMKSCLRRVIFVSQVFGAASLSFGGLDFGDPLVTTLEDDPISFPAAMEEGYLDVTKAPYNLDNDGGNAGNNTTKLQNAIDDAYQYNLAVFFPAGTYDLNNQLELFQKSLPDAQMTDVHCLVGSAAGSSRPLIRLQGTQFDNASNPKALFLYHCSDNGTGPPATERPGVAYNMVFRGIDIDLNGKVGAIGIKMQAAQGSTIQDVYIDATGAYAGIDSLCGSGAIFANIHIDGGKYAYYVSSNRPMATLVGITCIGQTDQAFYFKNHLLGPLTIVGFRIEADSGPVFDLDAPSNYNKDDEHLSLIDGSIEITGSSTSTVIHNANRSVHLRNVFFKHAARIVDNDSGQAPDLWGVANDWKHVPVYNYYHDETRKLIQEAISSNPEYKSGISTGTPPPAGDDLVKRHLWDEATFPHFEDSNVLSIGPGTSNDNDASRIQQFINTAGGKPIFLKKGDYYLETSINLLSNTKLFGVSRNLTRLHCKTSFTSETFVPMIKTPENGEDHTCMLAWLALHMPMDQADKINFLDWTAGRDSMVRGVHFMKDVNWGSAVNGMKRVQIRDSGGGRWYAIFTRAGSEQGDHPDHRQFYVLNTTEPLSIYGFTVEYHESQTYMTELNNAENVSIYGFKLETDLNGKDDSNEGVVDNAPSANWSGNVAITGEPALIAATGSGKYGEITISGIPNGSYEILADIEEKNDRGKFQLSVDGQNVGGEIDTYSSSGSPVMAINVSIAKTVSLSGTHTFRFTCTGTRSSGYKIGIDKIKLYPMKHTPALGIVDSLNVIVAGQSGHGVLDQNEDDHGLIEIVGSSNDIEVSNATGGWGDSTGFGIVRDMSSAASDVVITKNVANGPGDPVALFLLGNPNPVPYVAPSGGGGGGGSGGEETIFEIEGMDNDIVATNVSNVPGISYDSLYHADANGGGNPNHKHFESTAVNHYITYSIAPPSAGDYEISVIARARVNAPIVKLEVNGTQVGGTLDFYMNETSNAPFVEYLFGSATLSGGSNTVKLTAVGKNGSATGYKMRLDCIKLVSLGSGGGGGGAGGGGGSIDYENDFTSNFTDDFEGDTAQFNINGSEYLRHNNGSAGHTITHKDGANWGDYEVRAKMKNFGTATSSWTDAPAIIFRHANSNDYQSISINGSNNKIIYGDTGLWKAASTNAYSQTTWVYFLIRVEGDNVKVWASTTAYPDGLGTPDIDTINTGISSAGTVGFSNFGTQISKWDEVCIDGL